MNIPYDPGADSGSNGSRHQFVRACTLHRTIGRWPGDYGVGKNRHHSSPGTFNYLVGQGINEWVMFYPPEVRCSHAAGSNRAGPGIEFSGQNGDRLTSWQIYAGGEIIKHLHYTYGIPLVHYNGPRIQVDNSRFSGFVDHASVDTEPRYRHHNFIYPDEFVQMTQGAVRPKRKPTMVYVILAGQYHNRRVYADGTGYTFIGPDFTLALQYIGTPVLDVHDPNQGNQLGKRAEAI